MFLENLTDTYKYSYRVNESKYKYIETETGELKETEKTQTGSTEQ